MGSSKKPTQREGELRPLLKPREAYEIIGVGATKGNELLQSGRIPGVIDLGVKCKRIRRSVLMAWLNGEEGDRP